jgi:hypothetical protein
MQPTAMRQPHRQRGLELLATHLTLLNPDAPTARERLEDMIGAELSALLVGALSRPRAGAASLTEATSSPRTRPPSPLQIGSRGVVGACG